jgi:hypothetical protein
MHEAMTGGAQTHRPLLGVVDDMTALEAFKVGGAAVTLEREIATTVRAALQQ